MHKFELKTNKRVCFWGAPAQIASHLRLATECMDACGQNTGNLFIGDGLWSATTAPVKEYWNFYEHSPEEFDEKFDVLFVPSSNFLFEYTDLTDQYNFFSKTKAQIFMFGLGSQLRELKDIKLQKNTEAFIRLAADRSGSIGVRGDVTATIVRRLGISNVEIVGCPSMLEVPGHFKPLPKLTNPDTVVSGNFTSNGREHAFSAEKIKDCESALFQELVERNGYYVLQNERHEIALMKSLAYSPEFSTEETWHANRVEELFNTQLSRADVLSFLRWRTKLFFSAAEWVRFMRTIDFSFGTRFHGNVAAIRAGRAAYVLCHDYRTLELCQLYKIPHRVLDANAPTTTIEELAAECDMQPYINNYPKLQQTWTSFASRNGLESTVTFSNDVGDRSI